MNASRICEPATVGVLPTLPNLASSGRVYAGGVRARQVATAPGPHPRPMWRFPRWQPPAGSGLVALVPAMEATRGWVENLLAVEGSQQVVWAGLGEAPETEALELVGRFTPSAATLVDTCTDARQVGVALQVAMWLSGRRAAAGGGPCPCLTSWAAPTPPAGAVRIPHLVSISHPTATTDAVVWELSADTFAREHVDFPDDAGFFESHLETLLELRTAAREWRLPATAASQRLLDLLDAHDADLSIELVYRNADVFRPLLGSWRPALARRRSRYGS